jgi:glutamine amidotransferase
MIKISILDYETGNLNSLYHFFKKIGYNAKITSNKIDLLDSSLIVLPGVGAFSSIMETLQKKDVPNLILNLAKKNVPIIGICAGMQILAKESYEFKKTKGIGLFSGVVTQIKDGEHNIGWRKIKKTKKKSSIFFSENNYFFFNHSYKYEGSETNVIATTNDKKKINSIINKENIYGFQFHPEKSGIAGLELFQNLLGDILK